MRKLEEIYKNKKSDVAVFLGSGSSINNITDEQWEAISKVDSWSINNWIYHWFVPDFYHLEVKSYNIDIVRRRFVERGDDYKDTSFLVNQGPKGDNIISAIGSEKNIYFYKMSKMEELDLSKYNPRIINKFKVSDDPNEILVYNLSSSLGFMLDFLWRFKYKKIILFGFDMYDSKYFWTDKPEYGETHCQFNKDFQKNKKVEQPHNTFRIKDYVVWFSKEWMSKIDCELFVGHKDTTLYPELKYFNVENLDNMEK